MVKARDKKGAATGENTWRCPLWTSGGAKDLTPGLERVFQTDERFHVRILLRHPEGLVRRSKLSGVGLDELHHLLGDKYRLLRRLPLTRSMASDRPSI